MSILQKYAHLLSGNSNAESLKEELGTESGEKVMEEDTRDLEHQIENILVFDTPVELEMNLEGFIFNPYEENGTKKKKFKVPSSIPVRGEDSDYDVDDEFIDDEDDFAIEQLIIRPREKGYFVWKGEIPSVEVDIAELLANEEQEVEEAKTPDPPPVDEIGTQETVVAPLNEENTLKQTASILSEKKRKLEITETSATENNTANSSLNVTPTVSKKAKKSLVKQVSTKNDSMADFDLSATPSLIQKNPVAATSNPITIIIPDDKKPITTITDTKPIVVVNEANEEKIKKERQKKPLPPLPEKLQSSFEALKQKVNELEFKKGKLPSSLREPLIETVRVAMEVYSYPAAPHWEILDDEQNKIFWQHLKEVIPYQISAIKKLVDKLILPEEVEKHENLLDEFYAEAQNHIAQCLRQSKEAFSIKIAKYLKENPDASVDQNGNVVTPSTSAEKKEANPEDKDKKDKDKAPVKRLIWSNELRVLMYRIIETEITLLMMKKRIKEILGDAFLKKPVTGLKTDAGYPKCIQLSMALSPDHGLSENVLRRQTYLHLIQQLFLPLGAGEYVTTSEIGRQYGNTRVKEGDSKHSSFTVASKKDSPDKDKKKPKPSKSKSLPAEKQDNQKVSQENARTGNTNKIIDVPRDYVSNEVSTMKTDDTSGNKEQTSMIIEESTEVEIFEKPSVLNVLDTMFLNGSSSLSPVLNEVNDPTFFLTSYLQNSESL